MAVPGATIGYDVAGPPDAPAVLFVHAGVATRAMWDPQFDALAADHRVIRYDTRGYGDSPGEAVAYSEVDDLLRMLDAAGVERATVVGASRGGRFALDATLAHPDRVCGLVVIGSNPSGMSDDGIPYTENERALEQAMDEAEAAHDVDALVRIEVQLWISGPTVTPTRSTRRSSSGPSSSTWELPTGTSPALPPRPSIRRLIVWARWACRRSS